jgi:hypothetical protein
MLRFCNNKVVGVPIAANYSGRARNHPWVRTVGEAILYGYPFLFRSNRAVDNAFRRAYKNKTEAGRLRSCCGDTCFVKDVLRPFRHAIDIPIAHRVSRVKFQGAHWHRLPKSKIGNLESKIANAPLAQLAEQVTLNHWVAGSIPARCRIPA